MNWSLSPNTQAILLLTAPLIVGRDHNAPNVLSPGEYKKLARRLRDLQRQPADLLSTEAPGLITECQATINTDRLKRLLDRGFQLSQAVEHWHARAIWVLSRADAAYPMRLKTALKEDAPSVLYGCGEISILETGGLAIVGSREVSEALITYTQKVAQLASQAQTTVVSGGARGIDQAAMQGALESGGKVAGILADSLERNALQRDYRDALMEKRLALVSPYDPNASFNVGNAMQRNKLIYALANAALIVNSDLMKGGTWAGAVEQLDKYRFVPIYVRATGEQSQGLEALRQKGARQWPEPTTIETFSNALRAPNPPVPQSAIQDTFSFASQPSSDATPVLFEDHATYTPEPAEAMQHPSGVLFATARELLLKLLRTPLTEKEVASQLQITHSQATQWLQRLVEEGSVEKQLKPVRYSIKQITLFDEVTSPDAQQNAPQE
jgi:DNA processing protein